MRQIRQGRKEVGDGGQERELHPKPECLLQAAVARDIGAAPAKQKCESLSRLLVNIK